MHESNQPLPPGRPWRRRVMPGVGIAVLVLGVIGFAVATLGNEVSSNFQKVSDNLPDDGPAQEPATDRAAREPEPSPEPTPPAENAVAPAAQEEAAVTSPATAGRQIVYAATTTVTVPDVAVASAGLQQRMRARGALLFGIDSAAGAARPSAVLTFRVLPEDFQDALSTLAELGTIESQQVIADDVTERVVDLASRIATQEVSVERLRGLLDGAEAIEAIASFEAQLLERETALETLRGQLRTIENQVALATIVVQLSEPEPAAIRPMLTLVTTMRKDTGASDACPASSQLRVTEGDPVTLCVRLTNAGNTALEVIEVRDAGLGLETEDFHRAAETDDRLEPGEALLVWATTPAPRDGFSSPEVTARAVTGSGEALLTDVSVTPERSVDLTVADDRSLPGFVESVRASWGVLTGMIGVLVIVAGVLVPFLWFVIGAALVQRRRSGRDDLAAGV